MNFIDSVLKNYTDVHTSPESDILQELARESEHKLEYTDMLSGRQVGQLLHILVRIGKCERLLEVGTFTGYSAIWMADALPANGELITVEINELYKSISDRFFRREPYHNKIKQITGDAMDEIDKLEGKFDLIFLDADKVNYPDYFQKLKPKLIKGGIFVADNVLWSGSVLNPDDEKSRAINQMNKLVQEDPDFINVMLAVRDGLTIAVLS